MFLNRRTLTWMILPGLVLGGLTTDVWSAQDSSPQPSNATVSTESNPSVLYGVIRSAKDQTPLSGVSIRLENTATGQVLSKTTDQQGAYIFSSLPPGDYKIRVGGGAFSVQKKEGLLKSGTVGEMNFAVNALSQGTSEIVGRVFESHDGHRIPMAAKVAVKNVSTKEVYQVETDSTGLFNLTNIPAGRYIVSAIRKGYLPFSQEVSVNGRTDENIELAVNTLAEADIEAQGNKKIRDTTGAISIVDKKKFQQNLTTGATYTLMQNTPGIEYYSRSGNQGMSGGMNYMSCRGYTVGGGNSQSGFGSAGIEVSVDGVPMNNEADGGEIYDLGIMNTDIKSATVNRGVTTSRETGNYAAGCSLNFKLVDPTETSYQTINAGGGSYGMYYTSYVNNSGINKNSNIGAYNDFTIMHDDGFQEFTPLTEYQYYGNITKYLQGGKLYLLATANYKNYDRGSSLSLANYNTYGPTYNGGPTFSATSIPDNVQHSPFYKNWDYARFMLDQGFKDQITPSLRVSNKLYAQVEPMGNTSMPVGITSNATSTQATQIAANYGGNIGYQFTQNYYQAEGYKAGDIAEVKYNLFRGDNLFLGMKGQYATYHYYTLPLAYQNQVGGTADAIYSQTTITGYLEDHYRPVKQILLNAGFRVASVAQYFNDQIPMADQSLYKPGNVGASNGASMLIPMPHVGLNIYPTDHWKFYINGGESFAPPAMFAYKGNGTTPLNGTTPETVWDLSIGSRYATDKGFIALDAYSDYLNNMGIPISYGTYTQFENIASARQQGIELQGKLELGYGFSGEANYTYMWNVLGSTPPNGPGTSPNFEGDMIPFIPLNMANLAVAYDHGPFHATVDERYTGMMNVVDFTGGPNANQNLMTSVPAYWVTDLHLSYDLPKESGWYKSAKLYVDAYNLLNTNYYNPAGYGPNANSIETLFVYPGEPVNIFAGASFTF